MSKGRHAADCRALNEGDPLPTIKRGGCWVPVTNRWRWANTGSFVDERCQASLVKSISLSKSRVRTVWESVGR